MKKTGKIIVGVVSTACLVGTGYASWSINKGYTQTSGAPISGVIGEILDNSFGSITIKENDTNLKFDAPQGIYHGEEDLTLSYYVKAHAHESGNYDPYDLSIYESVSDDYIPYLNLSTEITDKDGKLLSEEKIAAIEEILDLPNTVIDYRTWLSKEAKENPDGYLVEFSFKWDEKNFKGVNPQIVYDEMDLTPEEKRAKFQHIIDTLKDVYFKFTFKVGYDGKLPGGEAEPPVTEKGYFTFDTVEHLTLKFTANNKEVNAKDELEVGTKVTIESTLEKDYVLETLTHNGKDILKTKSFEIAKGENKVVATTKFVGEVIPPVEEVKHSENVTLFKDLDNATANSAVKVEGVVVAIADNAVVLFDGYNYGTVMQGYSNEKVNVVSKSAIGKSIIVEGYASAFYGRNMVAVDKFAPEGISCTVNDSPYTYKVDETILPTEYDEAMLAAYASKDDIEPKYIIVKEAVVTISGNYTNFNKGTFEKGSICGTNVSGITFEHNKKYNLTGYLIHSSEGGNNSKFKNLIVTSAELVEDTPVPEVATKVAEVSVNPAEIKVGEVATVTAKDDLGATLENITITSVLGNEFVTIEGNKITGVKEGTFKFKVSSGELEASSEQTLVVKEKEVTPPTPQEEILNIDFKQKPDWKPVTEGLKENQYGARNMNVNGNNIYFSSSTYQEMTVNDLEGKYNSVFFGHNGGSLKPGNLPSPILTALTGIQQTEDAYKVNDKIYYGMVLEFDLENVSSIELTYHNKDVNYTISLLESKDLGTTWTKVATSEIADLSLTYKPTNKIEKARYAFCIESSATDGKARLPLDTLIIK